MERLQKKCIVVSAGFHLALVLVLVFGPAFRTPPEKPKRVSQINLLSSVAIEAALRQAEQNAAQPELPPLVQPAPEPAPREKPKPKPPEPVVEQPKPKPVEIDPPKPVKELPKPKPKVEEKPKPAPKKTTPKPKPKPKPEIKINFNTAAQEPDFKRKLEEQKRALDEQKRREREAAKRRREMQQSLDSLGNSLSEKSKIEADLLGGSALGNYRVHVKVAYDRAWVEPATSGSKRGVTRVRVVVNGDGSIASATIIGRSGNPNLDQSVQDTLNRVKRIERRPPAGTSVADRTFTINFNLKDGLITE